MSGRVSLVGAGPGDPALLTLGGLRALREADVVFYDALVSPEILAFAASSAELVYVGKRGGEHALPQREIEARMIACAREGRRVVRLKGGDPYVFGRGAEEAQALHAEDIAFDVVPGISSAVAAPAYAGIPLTHRTHASWVAIVTGHEDPSKPHSTLDWRALAAAPSLVVLMGAERLQSIAQTLVASGAAPTAPAAVVQDGTRPSQRCVTGTLASIAAEAASAGIVSPAVLVVGETVRLRDELQWFERGALFGKRVLVTRPYAQAHVFARALLARGAMPVVAPTIAVAPPDDPQPAARAIERATEYDWIVFLSRNAVEAFFEALRSRGRDARALGPLRIAAIGTKTAQAVAEHGVRADLVSGRATSEDAVEDLLGALAQDARVLVFAAQEGRDVVRSVLSDAGRFAESVAAYKTVDVTDDTFAEKVASCDILTFTSSSTVRAFARLLGGNDAAAGAARGKVVGCIGPITAHDAHEIGLQVDVVPESFTTEALIEALEAHAGGA